MVGEAGSGKTQRENTVADSLRASRRMGAWVQGRRLNYVFWGTCVEDERSAQNFESVELNRGWPRTNHSPWSRPIRWHLHLTAGSQFQRARIHVESDFQASRMKGNPQSRMEVFLLDTCRRQHFCATAVFCHPALAPGPYCKGPRKGS